MQSFFIKHERLTSCLMHVLPLSQSQIVVEPQFLRLYKEIL